MYIGTGANGGSTGGGGGGSIGLAGSLHFAFIGNDLTSGANKLSDILQVQGKSHLRFQVECTAMSPNLVGPGQAGGWLGYFAAAQMRFLVGGYYQSVTDPTAYTEIFSEYPQVVNREVAIGATSSTTFFGARRRLFYAGQIPLGCNAIVMGFNSDELANTFDITRIEYQVTYQIT